MVPLSYLLYSSLSSNGATAQTKNVLIIDQGHDVDWSKYLHGRSINNNQFSINVEQASYSQITLHSNSDTTSDSNVLVTITDVANNSVKEFKPDFIVIRQLPCSVTSLEKRILIGLKYAKIPSINTLHSCFNMADRSWTYSQLVRVQSKLGREKFPLIAQVFFPDSRSMEIYLERNNINFPVMVKVGSTPSDCINLRIENKIEFNEAIRATALAGTYATMEPFVPSTHDLIIQKIGKIYKAYQRTSKTPGQWHHACGEVTIDRVTITEMQKVWLDCAAELFGGLDLVSLTCLSDQTDPSGYVIMKIGGSWMSLFELENVQYISDIIWHRLATTVRRKQQQMDAQAGRHAGKVTNSQSQTTIRNQSQQSIDTTAAQQAPDPRQQQGRASATSTRHSRTQSVPVSRDQSPSRFPAPPPAPEGEESAEKIRQIRQSFANFFN